MNRRDFVVGSAVTAAALSVPRLTYAEQADLKPVFAEIEKRHDEAVKRLQAWIRQPSIAAENREVNEGCDLTMADARRRRLSVCHQSSHRRPARNLRHPRRRRSAHGWRLLHVRREAGHAVRMVLAAMGRRAHRQAWPGQGADRPRRGQSERTASHVPRRAARHPRRRTKTSGEFRTGRRR